MTDLTFERVSSLLLYDPEAGKLIWRARPVEMFKTERDAKIWNTRYAGKEAFTCADGQGYKMGDIFAKHYKAHRVAWLLTHGEWPSGNIDHINGNRSDNRIVNLRIASYVENARNQIRRKNNTSGVMGVVWHKVHRKWLAKIMINGCHKHLGIFDCFIDAVATRKAAERESGFHPNHGKECA